MKLKLNEDGSAVVKDGKPVYVHDDGKEIEFDAPAAMAKIGQLNGEAKSHRERAEKAEATAKQFEGISDVKAALKAMETVKNLDDKKLVDAGEVEKIRTETAKALEEKFAPIVSEREKLKAQLDHHLIGGAFSGSKFIADKFAAPGPAGVEIARSLFGSRLKVEDGAVVGYDVQGNKLYSRARPGELASADEAIEMLVDQYPHKAHILKGNPASGSGANPSAGGNNGSKTMTRAQFDAASPGDRMAHAKAGGKVVD